MALKSFKIQDQRGLKLAQCDDVPQLMIVCGANGTGKSTLLYAIKQGTGEVVKEDGTVVLYQPPHRAVRRQSVQRRYLGGPVKLFSAFLQDDNVGGFEGLQVPYPIRSPDNVDETGSTLKFVLGKLENRRQAALAIKVDEATKGGKKQLSLAGIANIYEPLDRLVNRLLPHLRFLRVDFAQEDNIRCVFERTGVEGQTSEIELDDLSSGEKSILILFMSLIEGEIDTRLRSVAGSLAADAVPDRVFLLDEPELHLHPDLQRRMLNYLRERSAEGGVQFLLVSHSATLLDGAADNELYILQPAKASGQNQLQRVATSSERLDALRDITGEPYFISTGRNIVCLEGEVALESKPTDVGLLEALHAGASKYTFVPMGGRSQALTAATRLRDALPITQHGVAVVALVDRDRSGSTPPGAVAWECCEVENLLLRPEAIALATTDLRIGIEQTPTSINELLQQVGADLRDDEVRLRVLAQVGASVIRPAGATADQLRESVRAEAEKIASQWTDERFEAMLAEASAAVDSELASGDYILRFRGKKLVRELLKRLDLPNVSYPQFCYAIARQAAKLPAVTDELDRLFAELDAIVQSQLKTMITTDTES